MQRYKNTVHTRSLLQSEADCSICNFCPSSPRGEIQWWDFICPLKADIFPPLSSKPRSSLKKMRLTCCIYPHDDNCFSLQEAVQSTLRQCFIARWLRSACWRHWVSLHVRHNYSGPPNLSFVDHCASDGGEEVARALAGEMCLLWRIRKCQDFTVMNFPRGTCCLVNAQGQKGMQDLNDLGSSPSKASDMLLNPEQNHRQSYWNLARKDKEKKLLKYFSVVRRKYCSDLLKRNNQLHCASVQGRTCKVLILHLTYTSCIFLTLRGTVAAEPQDGLALCSSMILTQLFLTSMGP